MAYQPNSAPISMDTKQTSHAKIPWYLDRFWRLLSGSGIFISTMLGALHHPYWLLITLLCSANLFVSALTDRCPMKTLLSKLGVKEREEYFLPGGQPRGCLDANSMGVPSSRSSQAKALDHVNSLT